MKRLSIRTSSIFLFIQEMTNTLGKSILTSSSTYLICPKRDPRKRSYLGFVSAYTSGVNVTFFSTWFIKGNPSN